MTTHSCRPEGTAGQSQPTSDPHSTSTTICSHKRKYVPCVICLPHPLFLACERRQMVSLIYNTFLMGRDRLSRGSGRVFPALSLLYPATLYQLMNSQVLLGSGPVMRTGILYLTEQAPSTPDKMVAPRQSISSFCYRGMFLAPRPIQGDAPHYRACEGPRGRQGFVTPG